MAARKKLLEAVLGVALFVLAGAVARAAGPCAGDAPPAGAVVAVADALGCGSDARSPAADRFVHAVGAPRCGGASCHGHRDDPLAKRVARRGARALRSPLPERFQEPTLALSCAHPSTRGEAVRAPNTGATWTSNASSRASSAPISGPAARRALPDDPNDETDVRLPLPRAVEPGETLTFDVAFTADASRHRRTHRSRGCRFTSSRSGSRSSRGSRKTATWAHFSFHPQAEFYADFGDYDVTLDVPADAIVGATGRLVESRPSGARRIERYRAGPVHDFAWTAWPKFQRAKSARRHGRRTAALPAGRREERRNRARRRHSRVSSDFRGSTASTRTRRSRWFTLRTPPRLPGAWSIRRSSRRAGPGTRRGSVRARSRA